MARDRLPDDIIFCEFELSDFDDVLTLWKATEGIGLNESDTRERIGAFLSRNPNLSLVARDRNGRIVGALLCGHDGRRGYLHHLAVAVEFRRRGIGESLVAACLERLRALDIVKCNLFLYSHNDSGRRFWQNRGWVAREDLVVVQKTLL